MYLAGLEYGEDLLNRGELVTYNSLYQHLEVLGYEFDTHEKREALAAFARECFHIYRDSGQGWKSEPHYINVEGYFKLQDYKELKEARESSREARVYAIIAIVISIALGVIQMVISVRTQDVRVTNVPVIQDVEIKNDSLKTEVTNFPKTQSVEVRNIPKVEVVNN